MVFRAAATVFTCIVFDSAEGKVVIGSTSNSSRPEARVGTVSGTAISFGTAVNIISDNVTTFTSISAVYVPTIDRTVFAFSDGILGYIATVDVVETSVVSGPASVFENVESVCLSYDANAEKIVAVCVEYNSVALLIFEGRATTSGLEFNVPTRLEKVPASSTVPCVFAGVENKTIIAYPDAQNSSHGTALVYDSSSNFFNWIGVATAQILNGVEGKVSVVGGTNVVQSGLVAGRKYYMQNNGDISTNKLSGRDVGIATSTTKLLLTDGRIG